MAETRSTMIDPAIETLLDKVDSKFTLVTLSAKRGRQINSYFNQLGEGLGSIVPPQVASVARKPLSIALEEIAAGKVKSVRIPEDGESENGDEPGDGDLALWSAAADDGEAAEESSGDGDLGA